MALCEPAASTLEQRVNITYGEHSMYANIERMIGDFEHGRMTRRQLAGQFAALMAIIGGASRAVAGQQESASTFHAVGLNHIALNVTDISRSRDFYVKHLGLTVSRESNSSCFLTCGEHFVALFRSSDAGLAHYCYSIKDYNVNSAAERLKAQGLQPRIAGNRIYFDDPDGLEVQLSSCGHRV